MKTTLIAAVLLALGAAPALAEAEGGRDPFALVTPGVAASYGYGYQTADTGTAAYPDVTGRPGSALAVYAGVMTADTGTEAPVQTANSLPAGAGTDGRAYAHLGAPTAFQPVLAAARAAPRG